MLCQLVLPALSAPVTGSSLVVFTVTFVILPPLTAVTVMPLAGLTSPAAPGVGEISRYLATAVAGLLATAVGLSWVAGRRAGLAGRHQQGGGGRERCDGEAFLFGGRARCCGPFLGSTSERPHFIRLARSGPGALPGSRLCFPAHRRALGPFGARAPPRPCCGSEYGTGCQPGRSPAHDAVEGVDLAHQMPLPSPPIAGLHDISPIVARLWVSSKVRAPNRAEAAAASHPACPPPTTTTS